MSLPVAWLKSARTKEEKETLEKTIRASVTALTTLLNIINEKETILFHSETNIADYDSPSWAYKQAFRNGQKATLREIKQLLQFMED